MITSNLLNKISNYQLLEQFIFLGSRDRELIPLPTTPLFGTDGIRGRVGVNELLNSSLAFQIGLHTGKVWQKLNNQLAPVILGQDSRNSSDMLAMALTEGLIAAGVEVWNLGLCPTPAVAHLTSMSRAMGGIMISASHNPPEDNGVKFFGVNGSKLSTLIQAQIEVKLRDSWGKSEIEVKNILVRGKQSHRGELLAQYIDSLHRPFRSKINLAGLKIVLDLAWGAAVNTAPEIFKTMGAEVITLHDRADGDRINVNCGSTHLAYLQQAVQQHQADMGFAFDGDADRVMAVDSQGQVVDGDYILYFWGQALRQQQQLPNNTIVTTVMANLGFENAWKNSGGTLVRTAVGDRHVHSKMVEIGAKLGGEQSGHILCPHYSISGDGVLTALHLAAVVKQSQTSLQKMLAQSFTTYPQLLKNVQVEDLERRLNWQDCKPLQKAIAEAESAMGNQGRVLVRPSGTEPLIRIMVETVNADLARYWTNNLAVCVEKHLAA